MVRTWRCSQIKWSPLPTPNQPLLKQGKENRSPIEEAAQDKVGGRKDLRLRMITTRKEELATLKLWQTTYIYHTLFFYLCYHCFTFSLVQSFEVTLDPFFSFVPNIQTQSTVCDCIVFIHDVSSTQFLHNSLLHICV